MLADYGASLLFDDAENLSDPKRADPDKRTLFLAGNRKGATIPVKEPSPNGRGWQTRWVNAFCPRGFTAISLPDVVLASRSIRLPLVRTSDPADFQRWPCNQRQLQDNLWATVLGLMAEAADIWGELDNETELIGREFEPRRPLMAVARLFERHGVTGLENRMRQAMRAYQEEKAEIDTGDRATQVLNAILFKHHYHQPLPDVSDVFSEVVGEITVNSGELVPGIKQIGEEEGFDTEWASRRSVGWQLKALRFRRDRDAKTKKRTRFWTMDSEGFLGLCRAYGLIGSRYAANLPNIPKSKSPLLEKNVRNGFNVQNVRPAKESVDEVRL